MNCLMFCCAIVFFRSIGLIRSYLEGTWRMRTFEQNFRNSWIVMRPSRFGKCLPKIFLNLFRLLRRMESASLSIDKLIRLILI